MAEFKYKKQTDFYSIQPGQRVVAEVYSCGSQFYRVYDVKRLTKTWMILTYKTSGEFRFRLSDGVEVARETGRASWGYDEKIVGVVTEYKEDENVEN